LPDQTFHNVPIYEPHSKRQVKVMGGPAGHKRARQVRPGKLPLQPSEHRRIRSAAAQGGAISDPGRGIIGTNAVMCPGYDVEARSHEARECGTLKIGPLTAQ
jgi:hypothetical protein